MRMVAIPYVWGMFWVGVKTDQMPYLNPRRGVMGHNIDTEMSIITLTYLAIVHDE